VQAKETRKQAPLHSFIVLVKLPQQAKSNGNKKKQCKRRVAGKLLQSDRSGLCRNGDRSLLLYALAESSYTRDQASPGRKAGG
jgi:hypothetical protein